MTEECVDKMKEISKAYVEGVCECVGEDAGREGLLDTPRRIARSMETIFSGYDKDDEVKTLLARQFLEEDYDQMIVVDNIDYFSMCEHHWLPFYGKVHVGYIPKNKKVVGLSKIPRVVEIYARRMQQQERLTHQIAEALWEHLDPKGVVVYVEGIHLCMRQRGVQKPNAVMKTTALKGTFKEDETAKAEFYKMIKTTNL